MKGRWIDVNRGDSTNWKYRSRNVAKEFNKGDEDVLFASTPLRLIISDAATQDQEEDKVIMVTDVARAFFEAPARRTICVELPEEETHEGDGGGQKGVDQGGVQKRQVQPQHVLPREGRHQVARANYLALDRPDIQYAVKEMCREMSNPTRGDLVDSGGLGVTSSGAPEAFGASSSRTPRRGSRLHRLRLGWLQEDSQEHERWGYLEESTHPQDMVRHPEERDPEFRRSRARGNGQDEL